MARTPPSDSASPHRSSSQPSKSSGSGSSWTTHPRRWRFIPNPPRRPPDGPCPSLRPRQERLFLGLRRLDAAVQRGRLVRVGVAILLAFETYSLLIGDAAPEDVEAKIRDAVIADEAVTGIAGLYTMHVGPRAILVVLEVRFRRDLTIPALEAAVRRLQ